ncbi:MAG: PilZ domain-containing protein, partial [Phycisphaerales bacterium]
PMNAVLAPPAERRATTRVAHEQPCKLWRPADDRFVAGTTSNLSGGGAMVTLNQCVPIVAGERVRIGMGLRRTDGFLKVDEMVEAEVVRSVSFDGRTTVALQYRRRDSDRGDGLRLAA